MDSTRTPTAAGTWGFAAELYHTRYGGCGFDDETPAEQGWWLDLARDLAAGALSATAEAIAERDDRGDWEDWHVGGSTPEVDAEWYRLVAGAAQALLAAASSTPSRL